MHMKNAIYFGLLLSVSLAWAQPSDNNPGLAGEIEALRKALAETQRQLAIQQREIETLKRQSKSGAAPSTEYDSEPSSAAAPTAKASIEHRQKDLVESKSAGEAADQKDSAESFRVGSVVFTPGGFVDLENVYRTANTQSNIATNFAAIPFGNTPQGNVSEFRSTAQFSRLNLMMQSRFGPHNVTGYLEADFSGNDASSVYQSFNGHTARLRLFFADSRRGKWEFLGGQAWSWLTPNRSGLGPMPVDLALTYNEDQNLGVGTPYARAAALRAAYHLNDQWAFGVGVETPNQYIGNYVALPVAFASLASQFDNGNQIGAPNPFPDILSKVTYDRRLSGGRHFHGEAVGLISGVQTSIKPLNGTSFINHHVAGGGGAIAASYEVSPNLRFLGNAFWSDGGAHYLVGTGPEAVIRPNASGTDAVPSLLRAGAASAGVEWHASRSTAIRCCTRLRRK